MRLLRSIGVAAVLLVPGAVAAGEPGPDARPDRVAALVRQLGALRYAAREAASAGLEAVGEPALPALRHAAADAHDQEVRRRAEELIRTILLICRTSRSTGLKLELVDPGEFLMGSPAREGGRQPDELQHRVRLTRVYLLGVAEVTQDEYRQVMRASPSWFAATGAGKDRVLGQDTRRFPVNQVTWYDAVAFCNRLSQQEECVPYYELADVKRDGNVITAVRVTVVGGNGYRLPTEAEWEYACRAGTTTPYHFGTVRTGREANFKAMFTGGYGSTTRQVEVGRTTAAGSYAPGPAGVVDLHGNVAEWCGDWYDRESYAASPERDPQGPAGGHHRVLRGGSWLMSHGNCRSASRFWLAPGERTYYAGFRVARTP